MSEVRNSYIHETPNITPGGAGYLMAIDYGSAEMLVENNIMWNGNKVIVMRASGGGNVVAYNYMDDSWGETYPDEPEAGVNAGHYTTPHMELIEGNYSHHYNGDCYWGNSIDITVFRNWLSGIRAAHGLACDLYGVRRQWRINSHMPTTVALPDETLSTSRPTITGTIWSAMSSVNKDKFCCPPIPERKLGEICANCFRI